LCPQLWDTLNLLIYWKQYANVIARPMMRVWAILTTKLKQNAWSWWGTLKKISSENTWSALKMIIFWKNFTFAIDNTESLQHDQNYDQQAKDTLFRNGLQCILFFVSIAGNTSMNMSVENNMLHILYQTN